MGSNDGTSSFRHFLICQILNAIWALIVWVGIFVVFQNSNARGALVESLYFIPIYIFVVIGSYFVFWKPESDRQGCLNIFGIYGIIGGIVWVSIYYSIYDRHLSREFEKAKFCQVSRFAAASLDGGENYAYMQVTFEDPNINGGKPVVGQACASDKYEAGLGSTPYPYSYYTNGEALNCAEKKGGVKAIAIDSVYDITTQGIIKAQEAADAAAEALEQEQQENNTDNGEEVRRNRMRQLKVGGSRGGSGGGSRGGSGGSSSRSRSGSSSGSKACQYTYNFSQVKIAAWNCMSYDKFLKLTEDNKQIFYRDCYYSKYEPDYNKVEKNPALIENSVSFYMVNFESDKTYVHRTSLLLFMAFFLVPFALFPHLIWLPKFVLNRQSTLEKIFFCQCNSNKVSHSEQDIQNIEQEVPYIDNQVIEQEEGQEQHQEFNQEGLQDFNKNEVNFDKGQQQQQSKQDQKQEQQYIQKDQEIQQEDQNIE